MTSHPSIPPDAMTAPVQPSDADALAQTLRQVHTEMRRIDDRLAEPLAVVGMGCRFPGVHGPDQLWQMLRQGQRYDSRPGDRWAASLQSDFGTTKQAGRITANAASWIDAIDQFDAGFFGISNREASTMDPQQRLVLEIAWETIEHAGIDPHALRGTRVGAFIGICSHDYLHRLAQRELADIDTYLSTGNSHGAAAGRLSYVMDWSGPAIAIDTACSSSLTAIHLAARSLRYRDCDAAIAMGVNVILAPELSVSLSQAGLMSPTRRCHTFAQDADGFVRGEGCGGVLLKRLSDAVAASDSIWCLIRGTATNQDGRSNGLTAPNGTAQRDVIEAALADARMVPSDVDYVEAHGTGTKLGDPIEVDALKQVFAPKRSSNQPLRIGSIKTNFGHLEGAAGIAGVLKAGLSIAHGYVPPHLNCNAPSDEIDWSWPVEIPVKGSSWDGEASTRTAGVSSFGFGGSNAHIVMSGHLATPIDEQSATPADSGSNPTVMVLSAKSARALSQQAVRYADAIQQMPDADFHDIAATSACCRSHFNVRAAWIVNSIDSLVDQLRAFGDTGELQAPGDASNDPLQNLCQQYRNGEAIDWKATFTKPFRRVNLPTYAFERKRRWFANETLTWTPRLPDSQSGAPSVADQSTVAIASSAVTNRDAHPFLRDRITPADGDGQVLIQAIINPCELSHAFVRDHQVRGSILFPAAGLLDLMIAIGQRESESAMDVVDFEVRRPVKLRDDQPVALQIKLTPEHDNYGAAIFMQRNGSRQTRWHQVASCRLVPTVISNARDHHQNFYQVTSSNQSSTWRHSIDASWYQADTELPVDAAHTNAIAHYESLHHVGLQYGPAFQGLLRRAEMAVDENQIAVATVSLPAGLIHAGFAMHPAMLDACLQAAAGLIPDPTSIWIPASVDRLAICGEFQADEEATVLAAALPTQQANQQSFDFRILDRQQNTVAIVDGLTVQRLSAKSAASSSSKLSSTTERPNEKKDARPNDSGRISSISAGNDNSTAPPQATSQTHSLENVTDKDALRQRLHHRVAEILDTDINDVPLEDPLDGLGLDSLMAFELRDEVDKHFGIEIPLELFFQSVSLGQFLDTIVSQINTNQSQQPAQSQQRMGDDDSSDRRKHFVEGTL